MVELAVPASDPLIGKLALVALGHQLWAQPRRLQLMREPDGPGCRAFLA